MDINTCTHHWMVETGPVAGRLPAVCRACGAEKTFPNAPVWDFQMGASRGNRSREEWLASTTHFGVRFETGLAR
jgi:hypothetical protein